MDVQIKEYGKSLKEVVHYFPLEHSVTITLKTYCFFLTVPTNTSLNNSSFCRIYWATLHVICYIHVHTFTCVYVEESINHIARLIIICPKGFL